MLKQWIILRRKYTKPDGSTFKLRTGKLVSQGAHASMAAILPIMRVPVLHTSDEEFKQRKLVDEWLAGLFTKVVLYVDTEEDLLSVHESAKSYGIITSLIQDAGLTEFGGVPTFTAVAVGPHRSDSDSLKSVVGHLPLL